MPRKEKRTILDLHDLSKGGLSCTGIIRPKKEDIIRQLFAIIE